MNAVLGRMTGRAANNQRTELTPLNSIPTAWDEAWDELALAAADQNPFAERWFMRPAIALLNPPETARMVSVWQSELLIGLLPLTIVPNYGRLPIATLQNWLHYNAFLGTPLVRAGHVETFWRRALSAIDAAPWAPSLLHLTELNADSPVLAGLRAVRRADTVHTHVRALLAGPLAPQAYYETHVRKKKRKELARLRNRLGELGPVVVTRLSSDDAVTDWIDDFLRLESAGWKGAGGAAMANKVATHQFFSAALAAASAAGRLEIIRFTCGGQTTAMLINFLTPPGSFSFKIAFDEDYARFSPGVLIQIENLDVLDRTDINWMDSCAAPDHPMIDSLWAERREIVRVTIPLAGSRRRAIFGVARGLETLAAWARR